MPTRAMLHVTTAVASIAVLLLAVAPPERVNANFYRLQERRLPQRHHHRHRHRRQQALLPTRRASENTSPALQNIHQLMDGNGFFFCHSNHDDDDDDDDDDGSEDVRHRSVPATDFSWNDFDQQHLFHHHLHYLHCYALVATSIRGGALVSVTDDHDNAILEESSTGSEAHDDSFFPPTIVPMTEESSSSSPAILLPAGLDMTELAGSSTTAAAYRHREVRERLRALSQKLTKLGDHGRAAFAPLLYALFGVRHSSSSLSSSSSSGLMNFWSIYIWSLIGSSVGFYVFLYFISVGYALGIGLPILITTMAHVRYYYRTTTTTRPTIGLGAIMDDFMTMTLVHAGLVLLWSGRLVVFLLWREYANWPALHAKIVHVNRHQRHTFRTWQKLACWTVYSFLYVCLVSPCWTRLEQAAASPLGVSSTTMRLWTSRIGIVLQAVGLSMETVADWQKSAYKKQPGQRQSWCRVGLWQYWPQPNYLGEWLFWCGTYLAGGSPRCHFERAMQIIGLAFISIVLHGAATTLRARQSIKYGAPYDAFRASHTIFGPKLQWPKWRRSTRGSNNDAIDSVDSTAMPSILDGSDVTNPELLAQS